MEMAKWEFYDDYGDDGSDEQEPTFSIYDFKKWLESDSTQAPSLNENIKNKNCELDKDALKEQFTQDVCKRVQKNIDKKMDERKKGTKKSTNN